MDNNLIFSPSHLFNISPPHHLLKPSHFYNAVHCPLAGVLSETEVKSKGRVGNKDSDAGNEIHSCWGLLFYLLFSFTKFPAEINARKFSTKSSPYPSCIYELDMNINISEILSMIYISMKNYKHYSAIHQRAFQLMNIVIVFVTKIIKVLLLKEILMMR